MYELLGQIYKEILEIFDTDVVHMGGDEVRDSFEIHSQFEIFLNFNNDMFKQFISIYCLG